MATCDLGYEHAELDAAQAAPDVVAVPVETGPNENDVAIAEIEAGASIEREKLWNEGRAIELEQEVARLRGELGGMRTVLEALAPPEPAEPDPVVIPVPAPAAEPESAAAAVPDVSKPPKSAKSAGWFADYR